MFLAAVFHSCAIWKKGEKERWRESERKDRKKPNGPVNNPPVRESLFKEPRMCHSLIKISWAAR